MHLPLVDLVAPLLDRLVDPWATASQQHARRNAMVAATALTQRRAETREVEEYLAARAVRRAGTGAAVGATLGAALPR